MLPKRKRKLNEKSSFIQDESKTSPLIEIENIEEEGDEHRSVTNRIPEKGGLLESHEPPSTVNDSLSLSDEDIKIEPVRPDS